MQQLLKSIQDSFSQVQGAFLQKVATKYSLKVEELVEMWNSSEEVKVSVPPTPTPTPLVVKKSTPRKTNGPQCSYIFFKGKNMKKQCTSKCSEGLTTCKKHVPKEKKPAVDKKTKKEKAPVIKAVEEKGQLKLVKNTFGNYEIPNTKLLIDQTNQKVYGKQMDDGKVAKLTMDDTEECKKLGVGYNQESVVVPPSEVKKEEEDEEEEDDEVVTIEDDDEEEKDD
jgi:hypothetical protein